MNRHWIGLHILMFGKHIWAWVHFNSLRPSDAYMRQQTNRHWFRYWLVAWPAPSHYLNQCWNIVNWTLGNKFQWNRNRNSNIFIQENSFENVRNMAAILSRLQCVNCHSPQHPWQLALGPPPPAHCGPHHAENRSGIIRITTATKTSEIGISHCCNSVDKRWSVSFMTNGPNIIGDGHVIMARMQPSEKW